jgi:hypothetical protein
MKLRLPQPGYYGVTEAEGTPEELAAFFKALGTVPQAPVLIPTMWVRDACPMGGVHEYPELWWSSSPPACKKCNLASPTPPLWTVTWSGSENPTPPCRTETVIQQDVPAVPFVGQRGPLGCTD